jgi:hypothetical protein
MEDLGPFSPGRIAEEESEFTDSLENKNKATPDDAFIRGGLVSFRRIESRFQVGFRRRDRMFDLPGSVRIAFTGQEPVWVGVGNLDESQDRLCGDRATILVVHPGPEGNTDFLG